MRTLKVTSGPAKGQSAEIERELVVGREDADFVIAEDTEVSRRHAAIRPTESGIEVEDLGSTNGTFVNGERIEGVARVTASGTIRVGETEIGVELALPQVTRQHEMPASPDVTAPRKIPEPDVTAPRAIPEPDVTAPRKIPEPDVTAPRKIPEPDVTAPRQIPDPDVTAPRSVPAAPGRGSDAGAQRQGPTDPVRLLAGAVLLLAVIVIVLVVILLSS
jgi:predicted component of type VI protein secretion system